MVMSIGSARNWLYGLSQVCAEKECYDHEKELDESLYIATGRYVK